jgi:simple sugar transport system ATP-binding protein
MTARPILALDGITKRYPGVLANDRVSLELAAGEVLGLLGENGAGKSTLMNVLSGLVTPDAGSITLDGRAIAPSGPRDALAAGIGMVHQHFRLVPTLSALENIALGDPRYARGRLRLAPLRSRLAALGAELGLSVPLDVPVGALDLGGRQGVEILKALAREPRVLILDEPTAVLAEDERDGLFRVVRRLAARGVGVILISHRLDDVYGACDRVVVLRQGRVAGAGAVSALGRAELVQLMVGADVGMPMRATAQRPGEVLIEVSGLRVGRGHGAGVLEAGSFALHAGEILGLAGVEGNGQHELVEVLCGLARPLAGRVRHAYAPGATRPSLGTLRRAGLAFVPEDRHQRAIVGALSLAENVLLTRLSEPAFNRFGLLGRSAARQATATLIERYHIVTRGIDEPIAVLSGGNQQKLVLARELSTAPRVLIAAQPTRGLDLRTVAFVQEQLLAQRAAGVGIVLVSSDLGELWALADRLMVAARGRLRGPVAVAETSRAEIGHWMSGA